MLIAHLGIISHLFLSNSVCNAINHKCARLHLPYHLAHDDYIDTCTLMAADYAARIC